MTKDIKKKLQEWAKTYHCADFIQNDPVQFPHRYQQKQDIEISGLLTAIMSFGNRKQILKKADELHDCMGTSPYQYVLSRRWEKDFPVEERRSFYRMLRMRTSILILNACIRLIRIMTVWKMHCRYIRENRWRSFASFWKFRTKVLRRN